MRRRLSRRAVLAYGATAAAGLAVGAAADNAVRDWMGRGEIPPSAPPLGVLDDASRLNPTALRGVLFAAPSADSTAQIVAPLLKRIATGQDPALAVAGTHHSMGGQSLLRDGWVLDTRPMNQIELDTAARVVRVGAGTVWRELIPVLNAAGLAPTVMQSNNDFAVGGSLSVNCHGWHANHQPVASTVRALRLLTAEGDVVTCSRDENAELFRLALGGYGMFGVILEADLEVFANVRYTPHFLTVPTSAYASTFAGRVYSAASTVEMAYGRLSVDPRTFLEEALIVSFEPEPDSRGQVLPLGKPGFPEFQRAVFRNSVGSEVGKAVRWGLESNLLPWLAGFADPVSRNSVLNQPAAVYADHSEESSDILHEYFVPRPLLWQFVQAARDIIRRHPLDLLNVTVRDVRQDQTTALAYARTDVFGLVMNFRHPRRDGVDAQMAALTRDLIDAVLAVGGTFYLPYRLHATDEQLRRAYPMWESIMDAKRRYDPVGVFRNGLYERYEARG